jgi:predicted nucleic acid-binding protein
VTPAGPEVYDPRVGDWTFDTCSLRNFEASGLLSTIVLQFNGRAHLVAEVLAELPYPSPITNLPWFQTEAVMLPACANLYRELRAHWSSASGADQGEAACITLAFANRWGLITDDGVAFRTATRYGSLAVMRTTALIIAMARAGWVTPDEGWAGFEAMILAGRNKLGTIPWGDRAGFVRLCLVPAFDPWPAERIAR